MNNHNAMNNLPLYQPSDVATIDRQAMQAMGIGDYQLMRIAASSLFRLARQRWPLQRRYTVLVGPGNNGGDGVELARLALQAGIETELISVWSGQQFDNKLKGAAASAWQAWKEAGGSMPASEIPENPGLIIDALFGAGLDRPLADEWLALVERCNAINAPVLAVDAPSGLDGSTGAPWPMAVNADATLCVVAMKIGLLTGKGPDHCGETYFDDLAVPASAHEGVERAARLLDRHNLATLPQRRSGAHKGDAGQALMAGGAPGMAGAILLAADSCARSGAGLTRVWTHPDHVAGLVSARPEALWQAAGTPLPPLPGRITALGIGPGLGREAFGRNLFRHLSASELPTVIDADGLYWLARGPRPRGTLVLTPHPSEAAALLRCTVAKIEADRPAAVKRLAKEYQAVVVLKGAGTLISDGAQLFVCQHGNPGMASGGMGDVLTGLIASLLAQGMPGMEAACCGVLLHAGAGDLAAGESPIGLLAGDLPALIRQLRNAPHALPVGRLKPWRGGAS